MVVVSMVVVGCGYMLGAGLCYGVHGYGVVCERGMAHTGLGESIWLPIPCVPSGNGCMRVNQCYYV
jgi:hypothetical protein